MSLGEKNSRKRRATRKVRITDCSVDELSSECEEPSRKLVLHMLPVVDLVPFRNDMDFHRNSAGCSV